MPILRLFGLFIISLAAAAAGEAVTIGFDEDPEPPWTTADKTGYDQVLIAKACEKIGVALKLERLPRKRAVGMLKDGSLDGHLGLSFKAERLADMAFPMVDDKKPDDALRLHSDSNSVYRLKGDAVGWDGKAFTGLTGAVGTRGGHATADALKKLVPTVDEGAKEIPQCLQKLLGKRVQAVVLPSLAADRQIAADPALAAAIESCGYFTKKASFVALSKKLVAERPELAKRIWASVAAVRETEEMKALEAKLTAE